MSEDQERYLLLTISGRAGLEMDIRDLLFENESFDVTIDKGIDRPTVALGSSNSNVPLKVPWMP